MPHTLTFRGAYIRYADLRINEAGVFCRLHFTSELTEPVMEAMEWSEPPDCITTAKLSGVLSAQHIDLTPNQKQLKDHAISMDASEVGDFTVVRLTENDSTRLELRFTARVTQVGAIQWCEDYLRTVGQDSGALKVSYVVQEELPLDGEPRATQEQMAAVSEEND